MNTPQDDEDDSPSLPLPVLSEEQIQTFLKDGVLVVENILTPSQVEEAQQGLASTLACHGVDTADLSTTGCHLSKLSSTNGSGGVLDLFYEEWKCGISTSPRLFAATTQLWQAAYCHEGETWEELQEQDKHKWQPYGAFNCQKGYCYVDRIGYRLPTELATELGAQLQGNETLSKKKKKSFAIQRSLTPHLDCCPPEFYSTEHKTKWRPIQCFVSLTDTLEANHGGFEAAKGFHRDFHHWATTRPPTRQTIKKKQQVKGKLVVETSEVVTPAPCLGEYTHIRPVQDQQVMQQVQHVPVPAGTAVFFDNRIPHANAYRHDGTVPRAVVYCSFLPDVALNRNYAAKQLDKWKRNIPPNDQWVGDSQGEKDSNDTKPVDDKHPWLRSPLARKLMGIDPW